MLASQFGLTNEALTKSGLSRLSGSGLIDRLRQANEIRKVIQNTFTGSRYEGERHLKSPEIGGVLHSFTGPRTNLAKRLDASGNPLPDSLPVSPLDEKSLAHDKAYQRIKALKDSGQIDAGRKKELIHSADRQYIRDVASIKNNPEPIASKVASKLIEAKMKVEQMGLPTSVISGFGSPNEKVTTLKEVKQAMKEPKEPKEPSPIQRLKAYARKPKNIRAVHTLMLSEAKKPLEKKKTETVQDISGGFAFLPALLGAVASPIIGKLVDYVGDKLKGGSANGRLPPSMKILKKHPLKIKRDMLADNMIRLHQSALSGEIAGGGIIDVLKPILGQLAGKALDKIISKLFDAKNQQAKQTGGTYLKGRGATQEKARIKLLNEKDKIDYILSVL